MESVVKHPGLRFHELKKETSLANGTLQHHLSKLLTDDDIITVTTDKNPRYFNKELKTNIDYKKHEIHMNLHEIFIHFHEILLNFI